MLLKLIEKELQGYYRFQKADSTDLFSTTGRGKVNFRISSSECTVINQITPIIRYISIAQFILDIPPFYRIQKILPGYTSFGEIHSYSIDESFMYITESLNLFYT